MSTVEQPNIHLQRLQEAIGAVCPILSLYSPAVGVAEFIADPSATAPQLAAARALIEGGFDWSNAAHNIWRLAKLRQQAESAIDNATDRLEQVDRAIALMMLHDVDTPLRDWITQFKVAVATSTNFANMQSKIAALPNMPTRTVAQLVEALKNRLQT